jgi:hypothetical protein
MRVVYVSGPYRAPTLEGINNNINNARIAAISLWKQGYAVIAPHLNTAHFDGVVSDAAFLTGDAEILSRCDAVYMLRGWENSIGARAEHDLANELGLEIVYE